jgi:hypothetical protein
MRSSLTTTSQARNVPLRRSARFSPQELELVDITAHTDLNLGDSASTSGVRKKLAFSSSKLSSSRSVIRHDRLRYAQAHVAPRLLFSESRDEPRWVREEEAEEDEEAAGELEIAAGAFPPDLRLRCTRIH